MTRYEQAVEIALPADRTAQLVNNGRTGDSSRLTVRIHGDQLTATWPARTGFDNPPQFAGRVQQHGAGASVVGTIRESLGNAMWSRVMCVVTVAMGALALFGAILLVTNGARYGLAPLLIGVLATPLAVILWRRFRRLRRPNFDGDAERLRAGLTYYLTSGDGSRLAR